MEPASPDPGLIQIRFQGVPINVRPRPPEVCPGCRAVPPFHPWGCPVGIRLCAAAFARWTPADWRGRVFTLSRLPDDPHGDEARHWRAVADEPEPAGGWTPGVVPARGGITEAAEPPAGWQFPEALPVMERLRQSPGFLARAREFQMVLVPVLWSAAYPEYKPEELK